MKNDKLLPIKPILKKMCDMVGADVEEVDFNALDWFRSHTWTKKTENEFLDWMIKFLRNKPAIYRALFSVPMTRVFMRKACQQFIWNFGWVVKEENE